MKCPYCKTVEMSQKTHKNINFDMCDTCGGFWFDHKELNRLLDVAIKGLFIPKAASRSSKCCPKCDGDMYEFKYPQTYCYIDMCEKCQGIWFDSKELEEIKVVRESFKEKAKLEKVAKPEGTKGALLDFINSTLSSLKKF